MRVRRGKWLHPVPERQVEPSRWPVFIGMHAHIEPDIEPDTKPDIEPDTKSDIESHTELFQQHHRCQRIR